MSMFNWLGETARLCEDQLREEIVINQLLRAATKKKQ